MIYDVIKILNQNDKYGIEMTIWGGLGKGSRPHGIEIQYYWKTYLISNTTLGFTWIKESNVEKSSTPLGITWRISAIERLT